MLPGLVVTKTLHLPAMRAAGKLTEEVVECRKILVLASLQEGEFLLRLIGMWPSGEPVASQRPQIFPVGFSAVGSGSFFPVQVF